MKVLYYATLFLTVLISEKSFAQDKSIEYTFDKELDGAIRSYLDTKLANDSTQNVFLELSTGTRQEQCGNYLLSIYTYNNQLLESVRTVVDHTSRFFYYKGRAIPICFDYDFEFIGYGSNKRGITRKSPIIERGYFIEFSRSGKIIRKG